jgi:FkbM family methyltransferase
MIRVSPREALKRAARHLGYEVRQYTPLRSLAAARRHLLEALEIDVVVDVGANAGQYGELLRREGFRGRLVSLEPVPEAYEQLSARAAADGAWTALRVAASDRDGELALNVTRDSRSSSVLTRNDRFADQPGWAPREVQHVTGRRLESLAGEILRAGERAYLKLDVQGYERPVIEGAGRALHRFGALELELSLAPLYEDQALLVDMLPLLAARAFHPVSLEPILLDDDGRLMEMDGIFVRDGAATRGGA